MSCPSFVFLTDFDFCGSIAGLMYNGKRRYKSKLGGVLTLMAFGSVLVLAIFYLRLFFARETPKMSYNDLKYWDPPLLDISGNFTVAVMMQFSDQNIFRDDLVKIEVYYKSQNNSVHKEKQLDIIPCEKELFESQENLFESLELSKAVCFNLENIKIGGSNVNDIFSYVQVKFLLCLGQDDCYDKTLIESFFEKSKPLAIIYFLDTAFDTSNSKNRVKRFINYIDINVTFNNAKETDIYFSKNQMEVDENYFFDSAPKVFSYFMIDSFRDKVSVRTEKQTEALKVNFMSSKNKKVISISFMQVSELLANVTSLGNVFILILSTIGDFINHFFFQNDLMNALYNFKSEKQRNNNKKLSLVEKGKPNLNINNEKINLKTEKNDSKIGLNLVHLNTNNEINKVSIHKNSSSNLPLEEPKIKIKKNNHSISPSNHHTLARDQSGQIIVSAKAFTLIEVFFISLFYFFDCCKCKIFSKTYQKTKQFKLIEDSMSSFQDFINVFKKLQEIDLLKYLLFQDDQLTMYGIIPKPECRYKQKIDDKQKCKVKALTTTMDFSSFFHLKQFHYLKSINEINESLRNQILVNKIVTFFDKPNKTHLDQKLIGILKDRINLNL